MSDKSKYLKFFRNEKRELCLNCNNVTMEEIRDMKDQFLEMEQRVIFENKKNPIPKKDYLGKDYVCNQCGADPNGMNIHHSMFHLFPPMTLEEAQREEEEFQKILLRSKP